MSGSIDDARAGAKAPSEAGFSSQDLAAFYEGKTKSILRRYGPGPLVHYHTGLLDRPPEAGASREQLRRELIAAQERTMRRAALLWDASRTLRGDVLDVGCGLGGGAIFWAREFGARVIGVTIAPSHVEIVAQLAARAGVQANVTALLCDALAVAGASCFDAAVAIDSSSSFPREPWFQTLERLLRPHGRVFIFDCFLGRAEYEEPFDRHWRCCIGTIEEYAAAAAKAGFTIERLDDVSPQAAHFWARTIALMRFEARETRDSKSELEESSRIHAMMLRGLSDGGLCHAFMSLARR